MKKKNNTPQNSDNNLNLPIDGFNILDPKKNILWKIGVASGISVFILQMMIFANQPQQSDSIADQLAYSVSFFIPAYGAALFIGIIGIICLKIGLRGTKQKYTTEKLLRKYIPMILYVPLLIQTAMLLWKLI
ncbi:MAG: hypothetical protein KAH48_06490 [Chlorobi bacterium]|nr:hypothetical protein [Chlorobiota bacterium]